MMLSSDFVLPSSLPTLGGTIGIGVLFAWHYEVVCVTAVNDTTEKMRHGRLLHTCLNNADSIVLISHFT